MMFMVVNDSIGTYKTKLLTFNTPHPKLFLPPLTKSRMCVFSNAIGTKD